MFAECKKNENGRAFNTENCEEDEDLFSSPLQVENEVEQKASKKEEDLFGG